MTTHRHRKHRRSKRYYLTLSWLKWDRIKIYLGITVLCFVLAGALNLFVVKGTAVVEQVNTLTKQLPDREVLDKILDTEDGGALVSDQIGNIISNSGSNVNLSEDNIAKAKEAYKDKLSQEEIQKLKDTYNKFRGQ